MEKFVEVKQCYFSRITGENVHYETPINPSTPHHIPGGSSSGSAVAVAAKLVDFAIGIIPYAFFTVILYFWKYGYDLVSYEF